MNTMYSEEPEQQTAVDLQSTHASDTQEPLLGSSSDDGGNESRRVFYEFESPSRPWWRPNLSIYTCFYIFIVTWFISVRAPWRFTFPITIVSAIHVITASSTAIICCLNFLHTPTHGPVYRIIHIILGRIAMVAGIISVSTGMYALYTQEATTGMRIGLTYAGSAQVMMQVYGMYALYKSKPDTTLHVYAMHQVFLACVIASAMRMPDLIGVTADWWPGVAWIPLIPIFYLNERAMKGKRWY